MECKINNRTELIEKYLSGELSEQEKESFEEHYFECDECFQELVFQQETIDLIKTEGEIIFADYLNRKPISVRVKELLESLKPKPVPISITKYPMNTNQLNCEAMQLIQMPIQYLILL